MSLDNNILEMVCKAFACVFQWLVVRVNEDNSVFAQWGDDTNTARLNTTVGLCNDLRNRFYTVH